MDGDKVIPCDRLNFHFVPRLWAYSDTNREAINEHFTNKRRGRPKMWNGRVLVAYEHTVREGVCVGSYLETDFASFDAWRDWGRPPAGIFDCFSAAVVRTGDGAFLTGVMGPDMANAGFIYFPCGTPDPGDIVNGRVDLEGSALRELREETGLEPQELEPLPGWLVVFSGSWIMHAKILRSRRAADDIRAQILDHLSAQTEPELADICIVREPADIDPMMPPFVTTLLRHMWAAPIV